MHGFFCKTSQEDPSILEAICTFNSFCAAVLVAWFPSDFEFVKIEKDVFDEDWDEVLNKYELGKQLGSGAFAVVKHVTEKSSGQVYAMKVVNKEKMASVESTRDDVLTSEVDLLNKLDHPNILKIHEVIDTKTKMFIFLELVRDGDLYDKLKREGRISEDDAREIFIQMADAIAYLHKENVSHRDLKPENILVQASYCTLVFPLELVGTLWICSSLTVVLFLIAGKPHNGGCRD